MNWRRLYADVQICMVCLEGRRFGAGSWAMLAAGLCRFAFDLDEKPAMLFLFSPLCLALVAYWVKVAASSTKSRNAE